VEYTLHDVTSVAAGVAPRTGTIIKNDLRLFERREHLLQNGIQHFIIRFNQRWKVII